LRASLQSGASSSGMLCCRMEWPGAPSGTHEMALAVTLQSSMRRCLHLALGGSCCAARCGSQWRMICVVTRRCSGSEQPATSSSSEDKNGSSVQKLRKLSVPDRMCFPTALTPVVFCDWVFLTKGLVPAPRRAGSRKKNGLGLRFSVRLCSHMGSHMAPTWLPGEKATKRGSIAFYGTPLRC